MSLTISTIPKNNSHDNSEVFLNFIKKHIINYQLSKSNVEKNNQKSSASCPSRYVLQNPPPIFFIFEKMGGY